MVGCDPISDKLGADADEATSLMFVIEDEAHGEPQKGRFLTRQQAIAELRRRAATLWNEEPNRAPCTNWRHCGRRYEIVEYDDNLVPRKELSRNLMLEISAAGVWWVGPPSPPIRP